MDISEEKIAAATRDYIVFAFKEGTPDEIRQAKVRFNELVNDAHQALTKSALMAGFHRPTAGDFREEFIAQCRKYGRREGML